MVAPDYIVGFGPDDFDPGFVGDVRYGQGPAAGAGGRLRVLLVGNMLTGNGLLVEDGSEVLCGSVSDAEAMAGAGSELARKYEWCLAGVIEAGGGDNGVDIYIAAMAESGGSKATMTVTFATTATSDGEIDYWIAGRKITVTIPSGTDATGAAVLFVAEVGKKPHLGASAANSSGVVTCTWLQEGTRGNDQIVRQDVSRKPGAMTSTLGGGAALSAFGTAGRKFAGGTTADTIATIASNTEPAQYHRVAIAPRDSTNLAAWETAMDAKAAWSEMKPQHTTVASNGALAATQSLTQTTLNNARFCMLHGVNDEQDPAELAAWFAGYRAVTEAFDPGTDYNGVVIKGPARCPKTPFFVTANNPKRSTRNSALRSGITPLYQEGQAMTIRRAVTTKCLDGTNADYRTLDVAKAYVPDFVRARTAELYRDFRKANLIIAPDPAPEQKARAEGVGTPKIWTGILFSELLALEQGTSNAVPSKRPILQDVELNPPFSSFYSSGGARRIMCAAPLVVADRNHQLGAVFSQIG